MTLDSFDFAIFISTVLLIYAMGSGPWRQRTLCLASLIFIASYLKTIPSAITLSMILLVGYGATLYARRHGRVDKSILLYIIVSIAVFMLIKKYQILQPLFGDTLLKHSIFIVGYSYLLFRQIHIIIDAAEQTIPKLSFLSYLTFNLNFLTLLAGPIQRYQDFHKQWEKLGDHEFRLETSLLALNRVAGGYVAVYVIAPFLLNLPQLVTSYTYVNESIPAIINFYTYPGYVFFNFAGYCSIVIGTAQFIGLKLPENFNKPYLSRDPLEFWNRWHITLSQFLRDYLFTPIYKAAITYSPNHVLLWVIIAYFIIFLVAGLWHGTTISYFVLGIIYGGGASIAKALETFVQRKYGNKFYKRLVANRAVNFLSIVVTLHFIAFSFIFIQNDYSDQILLWLQSIFGGAA